MVAALREIFAKGKHPSHEDKESAAQILAEIIEQAQSIGRAHASDEAQERAINWGGTFTSVLSSAWSIVSNFVSRITDWLTGQEAAGEDVTPEDIEEKIETLAETVASVEVASAIEQEIVEVMQEQGTRKCKPIAQPGACADCVARAAAEPVPIDQFEPPPYHGHCRCSSADADEDE